MSITFPDNENRFQRCQDLQRSMNEMMKTLLEEENKAKAVGPRYLAVIEEFAARLNYPTFEAMERDAESLMSKADLDLHHRTKADETELDYGLNVSRGIGLAILLPSFYGANRLRKYGKPSLPWKKWSFGQVWKNYKLHNAAIKNTRRITTDVKLGKISQFEADAKLAKLARDRALLAGPFWQGPDVDSGAKMIKWIHRLVSFFEVAGVVLEIGSLIADAVVGSIVRDKMRTAIDELVPLRFAMMKFQMMMRPWSHYELEILASFKVWIDLQKAADVGTQCYFGADDALENALDSALDKMQEGFFKVTDEDVYKACRDEDSLFNSWTNEDPSLDQIRAWLKANETDTGEETEDQSTVLEDVVDPPQIPTDQINGHNCRYVELKNGKGALWKLRGPYWTYQEGPTANESLGGRHRLVELERDEDLVYLQKQENPIFDGLGNVLPPTGPLEPIIMVNLKEGQLFRRLDGTMDDEAVLWEDHDLDSGSYSNLIEVNGWTVYLVPFKDPNFIKSTHECNQVKGWEMKGLDNTPESDLIEVYRSKTKISSAKKSLFGTGIPKFDLDLVNRKITVTHSAGTLEEEIDIDSEEGMRPRLVLT